MQAHIRDHYGVINRRLIIREIVDAAYKYLKLKTKSFSASFLSATMK